MDWHDGIDGPHREIAGSHATRIGILAGPGTGKTGLGLMRRVVRLLQEGVPGDRILLVSFTRVAAADLRDKVADLGVEGVENVQARTLHSYCFSLLQKDSVLAITGRKPRILLEHEVDLMLRDIGGDFGTIFERRRQLKAFVAGWARGDTDYPALPSDPHDAEFQRRVLQWLRVHEAMLIGEVVPLAYVYLRDNPAAAEHDAFEHFIVDEYQDLNHLEQELLDLLAQNAALCVAGDDDQSIYGMRYANPSGILSFVERDATERHTLNVCGRCPKQIVEMANSLIRCAPMRAKPDATCRDEDAPSFVAIVQWSGLEEEVEGIVAAIAADIQQQRRSPGDILVLTNWRRIGYRIRHRLNELEIPAQSFFTEEELDSDDAREALALLRLLVDENDAPALRVILGLGDGEGRSRAYQRLLVYCRTADTPVRTVLDRLAGGEKIPGLVVPAILVRYIRANGRLEELRDLELPDLVDRLLPDDSSIVADLRQISVNALEGAEWAGDLLRRIIEVVTQDEVPQHPDFVRVMSLHKSKGLTSPAVFLAGAIAGILPTIPAGSTDQQREASVQEGRRLMYVAVTRASEQLLISNAISMRVGDGKSRGVNLEGIRQVRGDLLGRTVASPYIAELGPAAPRPVSGQRWLQDY